MVTILTNSTVIIPFTQAVGDMADGFLNCEWEPTLVAACGRVLLAAFDDALMLGFIVGEGIVAICTFMSLIDAPWFFGQANIVT